PPRSILFRPARAVPTGARSDRIGRRFQRRYPLLDARRHAIKPLGQIEQLLAAVAEAHLLGKLSYLVGVLAVILRRRPPDDIDHPPIPLWSHQLATQTVEAAERSPLRQPATGKVGSDAVPPEPLAIDH